MRVKYVSKGVDNLMILAFIVFNVDILRNFGLLLFLIYIFQHENIFFQNVSQFLIHKKSVESCSVFMKGETNRKYRSPCKYFSNKPNPTHFPTTSYITTLLHKLRLSFSKNLQIQAFARIDRTINEFQV